MDRIGPRGARLSHRGERRSKYTSTAGKLTTLAAALGLAFGGVGCATKKHVRNTVAPIDARLGDVEKKTTAQGSSIGELENSVSRVDERVKDADSKAVAAGQSADRANQAAGEANRAAGEARQLAQQGLDKTTELAKDFDARLENMDNYQMVTTEAVLFPFNKSTLTADAKAKLDELAKNVGNMKHYVIEIEGFTDKTGTSDYNLQLSNKRADTVVRYLTVNHNLPLRRIHVLALGEDKPANTERSRQARKENRRVEVKVFSLNPANPQQLQSQATPPSVQ